MARPRWSKIVRDILSNRLRLLLVVLSIVLGVMSMAITIGTRHMITQNLAEDFALSNAYSAALYTSSFGLEDVGQLQAMTEIADFEARQVTRTRFQPVEASTATWMTIEVYGLSSFENQRVNKASLLPGSRWPAPEEIVIEESAGSVFAFNIGDQVRVQDIKGRDVILTVVGLVRAPHLHPASFVARASGFVSMETATALSGVAGYNELTLVVSENKQDRVHIGRVAQEARGILLGNNVLVRNTRVPSDPGEPPLARLSDSLLMVITLVAIMGLLLSGFLIANTISALLKQHLRQIGVMKSIGATTGQLVVSYGLFILLHSLAALAIALPLSIVGIRYFTGFLLGLIDVPFAHFIVPWDALLLAGVSGIGIPLGTAAYPLWKGNSLSVREALVSYGLSASITVRTDRERVGKLPPTLSYALRNNTRRLGRLALTLVALSMAGTTFISVLSVKQALDVSINQIANYWKYDVEVDFAGRSLHMADLDNIALGIDNVIGVEGWQTRDAFFSRPDGSENENIFLVSHPADSRFVSPTMIEGHWLVPEKPHSIVINSDFRDEEPYLQVGSTITLTINGLPRNFEIVGISSGQMAGPWAFIGHSSNETVNRLAVATTDSDENTQLRVAEALEKALTHAGIPPSSVETHFAMRSRVEFLFNILTTALLAIAAALAVVGFLSLAGTISLNTLERTREIGVLRAIGATDSIVHKLVLYEGIGMGISGGLLASLMSIPASIFAARAIGIIFLKSPLEYAFSVRGVAIWLAIALLGSAVGAVMPARRAARILVRDALLED